MRGTRGRAEEPAANGEHERGFLACNKVVTVVVIVAIFIIMAVFLSIVIIGVHGVVGVLYEQIESGRVNFHSYRNDCFCNLKARHNHERRKERTNGIF